MRRLPLHITQMPVCLSARIWYSASQQPLSIMKKVFSLTHPTKKPARLVEAAKSDISKYVKRERRKELPEDVDFVDFACRCGATAETAKEVHINDLNKAIDTVEQAQSPELYVEVIPTAGVRQKKEK